MVKNDGDLEMANSATVLLKLILSSPVILEKRWQNSNLFLRIQHEVAGKKCHFYSYF
jgi:hypothetical protein